MNLDFYAALAFFKLAVILERVLALRCKGLAIMEWSSIAALWG